MHSVNHSENIIEVSGLSFAYGDREVFRDINLSVHRGDYLAVVGSNGSGKTTLVKIILGLLRPATGSVRLFGTDINEFKDWSKIGYVSQKAAHFDAHFPVTVEEAVLMGRFGHRGLFRGIRRDDRMKARQALDHVEMWQYRQSLIGDLSSGQQQRVFIARALAAEPEVIFLDEPTASVEQHVRDDFYELLRTLNKDLQLTIVLVTHDIESMTHEAMHVACIDSTLFFHESVDDYFKDTHRVIHPHP